MEISKGRRSKTAITRPRERVKKTEQLIACLIRLGKDILVNTGNRYKGSDTEDDQNE